MDKLFLKKINFIFYLVSILIAYLFLKWVKENILITDTMISEQLMSHFSKNIIGQNINSRHTGVFHFYLVSTPLFYLFALTAYFQKGAKFFK